MARRNNINHKMFEEIDISTNQTSNRTITQGVDVAMIIVTWTGATPVGEIIVEISNSCETDFTKGDEVWEEISFGSTIAISGASGSHQINFTQISFRAIRIKYLATSGTGNLTAHLNSVSISA